ncbi:glycoside hydrolase family 43 protein [Proteiniphilum sp.]|uniref:glycoside hydrolase family 43 protein n=1 Tax=Proteiniphilum sp. TaxID=1926877 RepID=UPI00331E7FFA
MNTTHLLKLLIISILILSCNKSETKGDNNSNGDKPVEIQLDIPFADPFILLHEGTYYAYGTSSDSGFEVYSSTGLDTWQKHSRFALSKENSYGNKWFWAPEVYYNDKNNTFYLFYSAEEHICVATSDSPLGPFTQKDKVPMRSEKSIDSSVFIDDDGKAYIYFVRFTNGNVIWMAELNDDWLTLKEETLQKCFEVSQVWETAMARVVEGPSVFKHEDKYYMLYSANHYESQNYGVGYATADSPNGTWEKADENPILQKPQNTIVGSGHGAMFKDKEGEYKYVFHAHNNTYNIHPRLMYITDMSISNQKITMDKNKIIKPKEIK